MNFGEHLCLDTALPQTQNLRVDKSEILCKENYKEGKIFNLGDREVQQAC
ncbi:MAG: hypothetical protein PUP91_23885 [Rhizonema sp. PD37]|nr:hypothetical protein [Rhizonema sp. PD37]